MDKSNLGLTSHYLYGREVSHPDPRYNHAHAAYQYARGRLNEVLQAPLNEEIREYKVATCAWWVKKCAQGVMSLLREPACGQFEQATQKVLMEAGETVRDPGNAAFNLQACDPAPAEQDPYAPVCLQPDPPRIARAFEDYNTAMAKLVESLHSNPINLGNPEELTRKFKEQTHWLMLLLLKKDPSDGQGLYAEIGAEAMALLQRAGVKVGNTTGRDFKLSADVLPELLALIGWLDATNAQGLPQQTQPPAALQPNVQGTHPPTLAYTDRGWTKIPTELPPIGSKRTPSQAGMGDGGPPQFTVTLQQPSLTMAQEQQLPSAPSELRDFPAQAWLLSLPGGVLHPDMIMHPEQWKLQQPQPPAGLPPDVWAQNLSGAGPQNVTDANSMELSAEAQAFIKDLDVDEKRMPKKVEMLRKSFFNPGVKTKETLAKFAACGTSIICHLNDISQPMCDDFTRAYLHHCSLLIHNISAQDSRRVSFQQSIVNENMPVSVLRAFERVRLDHHITIAKIGIAEKMRTAIQKLKPM